MAEQTISEALVEKVAVVLAECSGDPLDDLPRLQASLILETPELASALAIAQAVRDLEVIDGEVCIIEGVGRSVIYSARTLHSYLLRPLETACDEAGWVNWAQNIDDACGFVDELLREQP